MSVVEQIRALEELASMDAELKSLEIKLTEERSTLSTLKNSLKEVEQKLETDRAMLTTNERARGDLVQDLRTMTQQIEQSRDKLNRSRTERESNAAQREMEELRKLVRDREDDIAKLTAEGDTVRARIEPAEAEAKKITDELSAREGEIQAKVTELEGNHAERNGTRDAITKKIPPQIYRRYETIRQKRGFALAHTINGTCTACNMALPPQLFHRLRREPMIEQCPSCNRIIYYKLPSTEAAT